MGTPSVGDVVAVSFPFSDLSGAKRRPAVVLASGTRGDVILCQVTSRPYSSQNAIRLVASEFSVGQLGIDSFVRIDKLFTANAAIVTSTIGSLTAAKIDGIRQAVAALFTP